MSMGGEQDTDGIGITPGIVPTQWEIGQAMLGHGTVLATMLSIYTPVGIHVTFWPETGAVDLGEELMRIGRLTKSGLHLAEFSGKPTQIVRPPR